MPGISAHEDDQHCDYGIIELCSAGNIKDARLEIGDPPLTLISSMGQRACGLPVYV